MNERLYHLIPADAWASFTASEASDWAPASLAAEGFVHLSLRHQLEGTLEVHFADAEHLVLLRIDPAGLGDALVLEASRGGAPFPHLYRALGRHEVLEVVELRRGPGGWEGLPEAPPDA